jgi:hypothetical protein
MEPARRLSGRLPRACAGADARRAPSHRCRKAALCDCRDRVRTRGSPERESGGVYVVRSRLFCPVGYGALARSALCRPSANSGSFFGEEEKRMLIGGMER